MTDPIFEPIKINTLEIKNRILMPAMHMNMVENFEVTDTMVEFYAERARGGAGMIAVGYATIDERSGFTSNLGAHKDEFIPGLKRLAAAIKENGARAVVQINHAGKNNHSMMMGGEQAVAPSAIFNNMTKETPRALEHDEILEIIDRFAQAAVRVKTAGFDAVEVLCGTGYLISSFLSPLTNHRTDEWGGSLENRMRFGIEIIKAIRKAVGKDFPILARLNGNDLMPEGIGRVNLQTFAVELETAGADALHINVGWHDARIPQIIACVPRAVFAYLARGIKEKVSIPVIASHRINDPETARELLVNDMCDMVAMGRPLIADPYLPEKVKTGKEKEVIHCIACAQGCFDRLFTMQKVQCLCNPKAGNEKESIIEKTKSPKKVMIIGSGPAGISAALAAFEKGHVVVVYEKSNRPGGQLHLAAAPPGREEFSELAKDLAQQLVVNNIELKLNQEVDETLIDEIKPDHIVLATGASPIRLPIPGAALPNVVQAWDVLLNKVNTGKRVVIIGGGAVGVEVALFLAEKGTLSGDAVKFLLLNRVESPEDLIKIASKGTKEVVVLEMLDKVGKDIGKSTRWAMMGDMSRYGVITRTNTKALEITTQGVKVERNGQIETIPADTVVMAAGSVPERSLKETLERKGIAYDIVGDANQIALAYDAVHNGFAVGRSI